MEIKREWDELTIRWKKPWERKIVFYDKWWQRKEIKVIIHAKPLKIRWLTNNKTINLTDKQTLKYKATSYNEKIWISYARPQRINDDYVDIWTWWKDCVWIRWKKSWKAKVYVYDNWWERIGVNVEVKKWDYYTVWSCEGEERLEPIQAWTYPLLELWENKYVTIFDYKKEFDKIWFYVGSWKVVYVNKNEEGKYGFKIKWLKEKPYLIVLKWNKVYYYLPDNPTSIDDIKVKEREWVIINNSFFIIPPGWFTIYRDPPEYIAPYKRDVIKIGKKIMRWLVDKWEEWKSFTEWVKDILSANGYYDIAKNFAVWMWIWVFSYIIVKWGKKLWEIIEKKIWKKIWKKLLPLVWFILFLNSIEEFIDSLNEDDVYYCLWKWDYKKRRKLYEDYRKWKIIISNNEEEKAMYYCWRVFVEWVAYFAWMAWWFVWASAVNNKVKNIWKAGSAVKKGEYYKYFVLEKYNYIIDSAKKLDRNWLTKVWRALQKHKDRSWDIFSKYKNVKWVELNEKWLEILNGILNNESKIVIRSRWYKIFKDNWKWEWVWLDEDLNFKWFVNPNE